MKITFAFLIHALTSWSRPASTVTTLLRHVNCATLITTIRFKKWTQVHMNVNTCQSRHILDKTKDKYIQLLFIHVRCDAWMTNTCMKTSSGSQPCHDWATKWWFRDPPFPSSGSMCTVTENQRYVQQSVWWVFLLLVCSVMGVENAMQHTSLPPQTLFCAANP